VVIYSPMSLPWKTPPVPPTPQAPSIRGKPKRQARARSPRRDGVGLRCCIQINLHVQVEIGELSIYIYLIIEK
jgi:hypothetical protein